MHNLARILLTRNQFRPSSTAFSDLTGSITYEDLERKSQQFAGWLRREGLQPNDRVGVVLHNNINAVIVFLGTVLAGGIAVMTSPVGRKETLDYKISHVTPCIVIDENNVTDVLGQSRQFPPDFNISGGGKDVAFMLWTSGTTGHSKAVMHSHDNVFAQSVATSELTLNLNSTDRIYSTAKLSFAYGIIYSLFGAMWVGAEAYLDSGLSTPGRVEHIIRDFAPTVFFSVPIIYSQLVSRLDPITTIKFVSSGDRLPQALLDRWQSKIGTSIHNCLGTTECLTSFIFNHGNTSSIGQAIPMYQTRIVDKQGVILAPGQTGQLQVRAPSTGVGYWMDPIWSERYFKDWITTGDICWQDPQGDLHHMGRDGDVIKIAGYFINPSEIEETLEAFPGVEQSAVIGVQNEHGIERIEAYVVGPVESRDLRAWMHKHHERQACPRKIHIVPELPRTDNGKIQRYKLRA